MKIGDKKIGIIVEDLHEDIKLVNRIISCAKRRRGGIDRSKNNRRYSSPEHGYPVQPTLNIQKPITWPFHGLIVPGGYSPDLIRGETRI